MFLIKIIALVILSVAVCNAEDEKASTITIKTSTGFIKGSYGEKTTGKRKSVYRFRSIPYAEPPLGDLRFEAPIPKSKWSGTLDVRAKPQDCVQGSNPSKGSEDCLYLKVYTDKAPNPNNKLPVLVYIYGGGFFSGYVNFDDHNPDYLLDEDIIVVGVQYRVGLLGFLSLGDELAPGNNGIRDQILALKWIKENIKNFGGDPDNITIFGQSAGAASVAYILQVEETKGLFSKAIMNSGSSLSPWAIGENIPKVAKAVAKELKINTENSTNILTGLKKIDTETLQNAATSKMTSQLISSNPVDGLIYGPVIEPDHKNALITGRTHENLSKGKFHHVPILTGYTSLEGYIDKIPALLRIWLAKYGLNLALLVPKDMNVNALLRPILGASIKNQYYGLAAISASSKRTMRYIADTQFEKPIQEAIRLYSQNTPVYAYHFNYEGSLWGRYNRSTSGVGHTEDLGYLYDYGHKGSDADYLTRSRMVKLWTNFVKTGNPTPNKEALLQNIEWPANTGSQDLKFLQIGKDLSVVALPNPKKINYWRRIYKSYGRPPYNTY